MTINAPSEAAAPAVTVAAHLQAALPQDGSRSELVASVIPSLLECVADISRALRGAQHVSRVGTANTFGDDQLNVDVVAEGLVRAALARCPSVWTASSEEDPVERAVRPPAEQSSELAEQYTVAFDPLDGSSIIAPNWTVGTILGIWDGKSALGQAPATKQVAAVLGVYGPRTTAIVALRVKGTKPSCFEVGLTGESSWELVRPSVLLPAGRMDVAMAAASATKVKYFSPANLRAASEDENYRGLVEHYIRQRYTLRYSGGLVPDVVHALSKGNGVYLSPVAPGSKAKLRRLYELCPLALIVECAGGRALDASTAWDTLHVPVMNCNETAGLVCGTDVEVELAIKTLLIGRVGFKVDVPPKVVADGSPLEVLLSRQQG
ncbi:hypothetical protein B0T26DRAFT_824569 [Lasiosphaeria miniovina]|uniref:Sedoheptulose-1,7-bisphosphatase n=1 Tax=Lasiosphaeria miniovina TaxID=1954250 RepID=A0AA40E3W5_9PEZI|nr:uncharacterized protein B0T26DRAFT_824569 [Lasiosphaeria miniovina]KAK0721623.1 hypothetical protein B0T26DRAFT_824569 [Lasiosphaeria miniovina]